MGWTRASHRRRLEMVVPRQDQVEGLYYKAFDIFSGQEDATKQKSMVAVAGGPSGPSGAQTDRASRSTDCRLSPPPAVSMATRCARITPGQPHLIL
jgi:hypothetical protein